jgi:hypothetical protein
MYGRRSFAKEILVTWVQEFGKPWRAVLFGVRKSDARSRKEGLIEPPPGTASLSTTETRTAHRRSRPEQREPLSKGVS